MNKKVFALITFFALLAPLTGCSLAMSSSSEPTSSSSSLELSSLSSFSSFSEPAKAFLVIFLNYDGTELQKSLWDLGSTPSYSGTPVRAGDAQYSFKFSGWSPAIVPVSKEATYTAEFASSVNQYTITFLDDDGTELQKSLWDYGATPTYPETPQKLPTAETVYTFSGWSPRIVPVSKDATYTARYSSSAREYSITFLNDDGTNFLTIGCAYGEIPSCPRTPTHPNDPEYSYLFSGWMPAITPVKEDAIYTAQFTASINQYTITFLNYDGTELRKSLWDYGTTPFYSETPIRPATSENTYTFSGWSPEITSVSKDTIYTAQFTSLTNQYTITFLDYNGTELQKSLWDYGATPSYSGTLSRPDDTGYTYTFSGWSPAIAPVSKDTTYTAQYSYQRRRYTITFVNYDGTELQKSDVFYDYMPSYMGTPTKPSDVGYTYSFFTWYPTIERVTQDATYTARYLRTARNYTITFLNYDGTKLQESQRPYDSTPSYQGDTPQKAEDADYTYSFSGWTPKVTPVSGPATYTAVFTRAEKYSKGLHFFLDSTNSYVVNGYSGTESEVVIPSELYGHPIKAINTEAFYGISTFSSVRFPSSLTLIGDGAFHNCKGLKTLHIPDTLTKIGNNAFAGCTGLTSVVIGSGIKTIDSSVFLGCTALNSLTLGSGVTTIGVWSFGYCTSLSLVSIPSGVTSIDDTAFSGCSGLTAFAVDSANSNYQSIDGALLSKDGTKLLFYPASKSASNYVIPASVKTFFFSTFWDCRHLASLSVVAGNAGGFRSIDGVLFNRDAKTLEVYPNGKSGSSYVIPDTVVGIDSYAFRNATALTTITGGNAVKWISSYAFFGCSGLTSITLHSSLTALYDHVFMGCTSLPSIIIPLSVTDTLESIFAGCTKLHIYCEACTSGPRWSSSWNQDGGIVYWYSGGSVTGHWHYVNGVPTLW
jgi:hypothetical protein